MSSSRKQLKVFSWVYIVLAVLSLLAVLGFLLIPDVLNEVIKTQFANFNFEGLDPKAVLYTSIVIEALFYFFIFWLMRGTAAGSSARRIVLIVLLVLSIIGSIINLINVFTIMQLISLLIDIYVLYLAINCK